MSFSATIIVRATCDSVTTLHGESMQYIFEEGASVRDLVKFATENYALGNAYMFQLKWKTLDITGVPKITTLLPMSFVTHGETYYMFINARDDLELDSDPSQMVLPTPMALTSPMTPLSSRSCMTPNTSQQYRRIFGNTQSPSTSFSAMSVAAADPGVTSFPVRQTSDYFVPNATPRKRSHRMEKTTITHEAAGISAASTASAAEVKDVTAPDSCETSASTSGSTSTATVPGEKNVLPIRLLPEAGVTKGKFLGMLYSHNQDIMDKAFAPMTKEPMIFYDINVMERMSGIPCVIAAFVLISHRGFADYDIRVGTIAREMCQKFVIDLVMDVRKCNTLSRDTVKPLIKHLNGIIRGNFFDYLITPDGPLFAAIRKRESRQSASNGFTPGKKRKLMLPAAPMDDVNKAANAAATAHTQEEIEAVIKNSSTARCLWISNMVKEEKARIPELVVAKFPLFKTSASWLQYDFAYTMEKVYNLPVINVSTTLETYAPAIAALAHDHKLSSQEEQEDASSDLLKTCGLLLKLIAKYFKKKDITSIERLVASSHDLPSIDEMIEKRRDIKQIAPMIFIIETTHGNEFFVSTDDFALKVLGNFGDALQCLTALHYVCYIEYAKELLHFNQLLENLCGINLEKMPKGRRTLKMDLDAKMPGRLCTVELFSVIPIKAWKTIRKELPKLDHTQQLKLNASCTNGNLKVHNAEKIRRIQLRAKNSYMVVTPNSSEITVEIPTRLILSDQKVEITVWDIYENTNKTTIVCSAVDICERIEPCYFCIEEIINPQCRPIKYLLFISNMISLSYIILHKLCKLRSRRRARKNSDALFETETTSTTKYFKRKSTTTPLLPLHRRVSNPFLTSTICLAIICLIFISTVNGCGEDNAITASQEECSINSHGWINCSISQVTQLTTSTERTSCLLMNYEGRPLGTIHVHPTINSVCNKMIHHYTRVVETKTASEKICPGREHCKEDNCARTKADTIIQAFGIANDLPGTTYCTETCSGWMCGCWWGGEGCLYYRNYAAPIDVRVFEVFSCSEWHIRASINVTVSTHTSTSTRILSLNEGHSADFGKIRLTLMDANVENTIPMINQQFISTEKSVALLNDIGIKAADLVKCETPGAAESFKNCTFLEEACRCLPASGKAACSCLQNTVFLKLLNQNALPLKFHQTWLQPTKDKGVLATYEARPKLQISVRDLKLTTVIDQNACHAEFQKLSGCANCPEGATASFTCSTDFGESEGHVFCGETISFPLKCTRAGNFQEVNIYLNELKVDLNCNLTCPSNKQQLNIRGSLVKSIAENPWSHRHVADAQPTSSFILPALEALTDFWKTSWYYMIGTLIIAGIIALIILKHI